MANLRSEYLDLSSLLMSGRSSGYPVATVSNQIKTWEEFLREVSAWKASLELLRVQRVALHHAQTWDFACALFGAWSLGIEVIVPGDTLPSTCAALEEVADAFVGDFPGTPALSKAQLAIPSSSGISSLPGWPSRKSQSSVCLRVFTSGSTGKPEAFTKSFSQLSAEVECLEATFGESLGSAAMLSTVSHQHIYGLLFKVLWPLCAGREILSQTLFFPEEILAAARQFSSVALISSPAHLKRLPEHLNWSELLGQWKSVFSSGGPLPWEAARLSKSLLDQAPVEVYGSSETGGIAWRKREEEHSRWTPFLDVELKLDPQTQCLQVRSPKLPDANWFVTADRINFGPDGSFELLGRQDRILKIEEKRISLNAIEAALMTSGLVSEAKVLALAAARESLGAVLVLNSKGSALEHKILQKRLREAVAEKVERVGIPKRWRFVDALPLNAQGKTPLDLLLKLFEDDMKLPEILKSSKPELGRVTLDLRLPENLHYFKGHFPGAPVLPGVVQIDWARHYALEYLNLSGDFAGMEALKFQQVLQPGNEVTLHLEYSADNQKLKFRYVSERGRHSSGVLLFPKIPLKVCLVIPVYNHEQALTQLLESLRPLNLYCILVDDASSPESAKVLDQLTTREASWVSLIRHELNQGKGGAVMTGVKKAASLGYTHVLQIDADGQHAAEDIPRFLTAAEENPTAVICGAPRFDASAPKSRRWGRLLTNVWVWINTLSFDIEDGMCGFRLYPLPPLLKIFSEVELGLRMDFDPELLVRLKWEGLKIVTLPVNVRYPLDGASHFRLGLDNWLISVMHTRLFFGMLTRLPQLLKAKWLSGARVKS